MASFSLLDRNERWSRCQHRHVDAMKKSKMKAADGIPKPLVDKDWMGGCGFILPILNGTVSLFVGGESELFAYFSDAKAESTKRMMANARLAPRAAGVVTGTTLWDGASAMIWLPKLDLGDEANVGSLYHEALHVALLTIDRTGVEVGKHGEILAYLQGYIVKSLLEELRAGRYGTVLPDGTRCHADGSKE